jgi:hypothetical protein
MEIKTTEFFRNFKSLPPKGTKEFDDLVEWELEKCLGGVNIGGIHIPGILYGYLNHWNLIADSKDKYGNIIRVPKHPDLRDNEWERAEYYEKCRRNQKGYIEVGLRQGGKSEWEAGQIGMTAILFENSQSVLVAGNGADLKLLTEKIDFGWRHMWEGIKIPKLDKDWRKPTVRLGFKDKSNEDHVWSWVMVRNAEDGVNTEAAAGTTAKAAVLDEIGKYPFSPVFEALKPALVSEYGWRCVPMLVGTGGAFEKGANAERYFYHPRANNFQEVYDPESGKETGLFMSGLYRQDCKYWSNLHSYLLDKGVADLDEDLKNVPMKVSDKDKALKVITEERLQKSKDPDKTEYLKLIMYFPLNPKECFLSGTTNPFPVQAAQEHLDRLTTSNITGRYIRLYRDSDGKVKHKFAENTDLPISDFPTKGNTGKDCPIVVWEEPIPNAPRGLYVAGADPYNNDVSDWSDSLGTVTIYKRMTDVAGETYQDMMVASMASRPERMDTWHEEVEMLLEYYNAICFPENAAGTFIQYFERKNKGHYLGQGFNIAREINSNTKANQGGKIYGLSPTLANINYCMSLMIEYCKEMIQIGTNPETSEPMYKLGVTRILDPVLLKEIVKYDPEQGNYDRIVAFRHALAYAKHLDKYYPIVGIEELKPIQGYRPSVLTMSPFSMASSTFTKANSPFPKMPRNAIR